MLYPNVKCNYKKLKHEVSHQVWDGPNQVETHVLCIRTGVTGKMVHL